MVLPLLRSIAPDAVAEHQFAKPRRWRFDFAIPSRKLAIEVNGAVWTNGRHSRGSGLVKEYEKMRAAAVLGWRVFPFTPQEIHLIVPTIQQASEIK